ncbi:putative enzyme [Frankia canadensis]|uniref:Putative enzyme n=1 Tax=Frankia canadensis TaxID=1836972 RepID=A0A2I2L2Q6_9ACTN|nr:aldo/keto reductase [Frankia canadensis]SNQ52199.1 putative enzyme [Frankia canadensis]SOU59489.1 putative enzyme [Frankia canadensis]
MRYVDHSVTTSTKRISKIGLGTWQFGSREWGYGNDYAGTGAALVVRRALELGITLFDTAEVYGLGRSERILGAALAADPDAARDAYVATKIMPVLPVGPVVEQRAVASAHRLGLRHLDLYQVHQPNPAIRDGATMPGMRALRAVGLVGDVGVSNYPLARWQAADAALGAPVLSNQVEYSLARPRRGAALLDFAARESRIVIAYSPLGQGLLSGRYDATHRPSGRVRSVNPLFLPDNLVRATPLLDVLRDVAAGHGATPAQIALAWAIHHPQVVAIPGASGVAQVESNAAAAEIALTNDEYAALTTASDRFTPVAGRAAFTAVAGETLRGAGIPWKTGRKA